MSTSATRAAAAASGRAAFLAALAALLLPGAAAAQLRNSRHDLSSTSTASVKAVSETEICKFCHTPHGAEATQLLWNRRQTAQGAYVWGAAATAAGTPLPSSLLPRSKMCLGCHDGSIALGELRMAGPGGPGTLTIPDVPNRVVGGRLVKPAAGTDYTVGLGGNMSGSHPVSIPYAGQNGYNGLNSSVTGAALSGYRAVATGAACQNRTGICTSTTGVAGLNGAIIELYQGSGGVGVECNSCHEPHNEYGFQWMLRADAAASDNLCRSCHTK